MHEAESSPQEGDAHLPVPDLSQQRLDDVLTSEDTALANSVRRLLRGIGQSGEGYAAHGSTP